MENKKKLTNKYRLDEILNGMSMKEGNATLRKLNKKIGNSTIYRIRVAKINDNYNMRSHIHKLLCEILDIPMEEIFTNAKSVV